jgi:hypothetical protein
LNDWFEHVLAPALVSLVAIVIGGIGGYLARRPIEAAGVKKVANDAVQSLISGQDVALKRQDKVLERISDALEECERERRQDREHFEGRIEQLRGEVNDLKQVGVSQARVGQ